MKEKRSTKAKSKQLAQVTIVAKSLVCDASSTLDAVGALRLHAPNIHIPLISALRMNITIIRIDFCIYFIYYIHTKHYEGKV